MRIFFDIECFPNYFLIMFITETGKRRHFEMFEGDELDLPGLSQVLFMEGATFVSFNGRNYDIPMLALALSGVSCATLKKASDDIINNDLTPWDFGNKYRVRSPEVDHIDIMEVAKGQCSLKIYGGRLHCKLLQDLPFEPSTHIGPDDAKVVRHYCRNDIDVTMLLHDKLKPQIALREKMSARYNLDLRSKSDAQIAEAVLRSEVSRMRGSPVFRMNIRHTSFSYIPPEYIHFNTPQLRDVLEIVTSAEMQVEASGHVRMPDEIENLVIRIGESEYKIGIGGLHSRESEVAHFSDEQTLLIDRDVTSYYPTLMLNMQMVPPALGPMFTHVFSAIKEERLKAKRAGNDPVTADALKIVLNGTFGKTSQYHSVLYNPELMVRTTLTGQLSLLMLIEALEQEGLPVVSANTDGVVIKCLRNRKQWLDEVVAEWEQTTGLETEETRYKALYCRDVNNYIAIKEDGKLKLKGIFAKVGIEKNPQNEICVEAVAAYVNGGTPFPETVRTCKDIRKFLTLRAVKGGAVKDGKYLGKAVRWYYATGTEGTINYSTNGNVVPRTAGAKPLMLLPDEFPDDVDYGWYEQETFSLLMGIGAFARPDLGRIPRRNSKAWKALFETGSIVQVDDKKYVWKEELYGASS